MKNSLFKTIVCFGMMFAVGILTNHKVSAEKAVLWMEVESAEPIIPSAPYDMANGTVISNEGKVENVMIGRSVLRIRNERYMNGVFSYLDLEEGRVPHYRRTYRGDLELENQAPPEDDPHFEDWGFLQEDDKEPEDGDYRLSAYYLTLLACVGESSELEKHLRPQVSGLPEGILSKPITIKIGDSYEVKCYLTLGNRVMTPFDEFINELEKVRHPLGLHFFGRLFGLPSMDDFVPASKKSKRKCAEDSTSKESRRRFPKRSLSVFEPIAKKPEQQCAEVLNPEESRRRSPEQSLSAFEPIAKNPEQQCAEVLTSGEGQRRLPEQSLTAYEPIDKHFELPRVNPDSKLRRGLVAELINPQELMEVFSYIPSVDIWYIGDDHWRLRYVPDNGFSFLPNNSFFVSKPPTNF